jgi:hypothetical protein
MPDPDQALAATFVQSRGSFRKQLAGGLGGPVGAAIGTVGLRPNPLPPAAIGYLGVFEDDVVLFRGKRGMTKYKTTNEVILSFPRTDVASATVRGGVVTVILTVSFTDGATWEFEVARVAAGQARRVAELLTLP